MYKSLVNDKEMDVTGICQNKENKLKWKLKQTSLYSIQHKLKVMTYTLFS